MLACGSSEIYSEDIYGVYLVVEVMLIFAVVVLAFLLNQDV